MPERDRLSWVGGPLDGCIDLFPKNRAPILWHGPDPTDHKNKVIVYALRSIEGKTFYQYDQSLTDSANLRIQQIRAEGSEEP